MKILVSITSTAQKPDFEARIGEIKENAIDEIALFVTMLDFEARQELYKLLENSGINNIPFVHLRSDMRVAELDYLTENFKTEVFNIHGINSENPFTNDLSKYTDRIYIENQYQYEDESELARYDGLCLDVSHVEDMRMRRSKVFPYYMDLMKKKKIGCGHISAIKRWPWIYWPNLSISFSYHDYNKLSQFDYLKKYKEFLPPIMALELENNISEQIKAKNYIEKILS